jgi:hypothetical protein
VLNLLSVDVYGWLELLCPSLVGENSTRLLIRLATELKLDEITLEERIVEPVHVFTLNRPSPGRTRECLVH